MVLTMFIIFLFFFSLSETSKTKQKFGKPQNKIFFSSLILLVVTGLCLFFIFILQFFNFSILWSLYYCSFRCAHCPCLGCVIPLTPSQGMFYCDSALVWAGTVGYCGCSGRPPNHGWWIWTQFPFWEDGF